MPTSKTVVVLDTSILCVLLKVPGLETCGPDSDQWDFERVNEEIEMHIKEKNSLILPLTTIIETGNHIAQSPGDCYAVAVRLGEVMTKAADEVSPWAAFSEQGERWSSENLKKLAEEWPQLASQRLSIGDATIKDVAEYYAAMGCDVLMLTGDQQLAAYQPTPPPLIPRRRR